MGDDFDGGANVLAGHDAATPLRGGSAGEQAMMLWHVPEDPAGKNPYGQLLKRSLAERGVRVVPILYNHLFALQALAERPDVVHFQFIAPFILPAPPSRSRWRALVKGPMFLGQVLLLRLIGCRIVWTVHNLVNHERRLARWEWFFSLLFTRLAHSLVVHGETARQEVIAMYHLQKRQDRVNVLFHPNYAGAYPDPLTREQARQALGIGQQATVILSIGQIRPYKGLPELISAFRAMPGRAGVELWIAGEAVDEALVASLQRDAEAGPGVHLRLGHQSPAEVGMLLKACDLVALPYRHILTSGAALLAMTFGRPCAAPRLGCLTEVLDEDGAFLYDPMDADGLRDALARAAESFSRLPAMGEHNRTRAAAWSWPVAAELLLGLYNGRSAAPVATGMRGE
jgi:glycosyltransferase involved in cell wall biosynthesis